MMKKKIIIILLLGFVFELGMLGTPLRAGIAGIGETTVNAEFQPDKLTLDSVPKIFSFKPIPLTLYPDIIPLGENDTYQMIVTDNRGTDSGYNVTVQAEKMRTKEGIALSGNNIKIANPNANPVKNNVPNAKNQVLATLFM
ncbi:hypothetical protein AZF37_07215 [endosymbiont 'TC1' of Trimyema compressum]|uniref:WxL domain-containing protein n=1 Tax=endosymbiont 'TC1' of Trimyema compressum TaxID=243899 RepID=UPI0007F0A418|nr:WxL domain-containing protein [endosymbiont 'TC1' of Trimyema compressum]AMP20978.1 hypothetical protein AZF37_07215 [endosymbiont 'TC1' of Trimyema compressum]